MKNESRCLVPASLELLMFLVLLLDWPLCSCQAVLLFIFSRGVWKQTVRRLNLYLS